MRNLVPRFLCGSILLVVVNVLPAHADPVTVTGGSLIGNPFRGDAGFTFTGDGLFLTAGSDSFVTPLRSCIPCNPAKPVTLGFSSEVFISAEGGQPGEFMGVSYPFTAFNGHLDFFGPTFSPAALSPSNLTFTAPFSMTGTLDIFLRPGEAFRGGPPAFTAPLTGSGTATVQFTMEPPSVFPGQQLFDVKTITYQFSAASPTPEPASGLLLGSGVVGLLWRRWRSESARPF
jgi:hypothetical protein